MNKYEKKYKKSRNILIILLLIIFIFSINVYNSYKGFYKIQNPILEDGNYKIGKVYIFRGEDTYKIYEKGFGLYDGELISLNKINEVSYIYYNGYSNGYKYYILKDSTLYGYDEEKLINLEEKEQLIFKDLKDNKKIVIEGKVYE